jgi:transcriptional regulator with XRE-family HTH domain
MLIPECTGNTEDIMSGEEIGRLRKEKGLTQIQLAQAARVSLTTIANVEKGLPCSEQILRRIYRGLGVGIGGPDRALWADELTEDQKRVWAPIKEAEASQRVAEKEFNDRLGVLLQELGEKINTNDYVIFENIDYQIGFGEFLWLMKKYEIKFPKGIL